MKPPKARAQWKPTGYPRAHSISSPSTATEPESDSNSVWKRSQESVSTPFSKPAQTTIRSSRCPLGKAKSVSQLNQTPKKDQRIQNSNFQPLTRPSKVNRSSRAAQYKGRSLSDIDSRILPEPHRRLNRKQEEEEGADSENAPSSNESDLSLNNARFASDPPGPTKRRERETWKSRQQRSRRNKQPADNILYGCPTQYQYPSCMSLDPYTIHPVFPGHNPYASGGFISPFQPAKSYRSPLQPAWMNQPMVTANSPYYAPHPYFVGSMQLPTQSVPMMYNYDPNFPQNSAYQTSPIGVAQNSANVPEVTNQWVEQSTNIVSPVAERCDGKVCSP